MNLHPHANLQPCSSPPRQTSTSWLAPELTNGDLLEFRAALEECLAGPAPWTDEQLRTMAADVARLVLLLGDEGRARPESASAEDVLE